MRSPSKIAQTVETIIQRLGDQSLDSLYRDRVRPLRTRSYSLNAPPRLTTIEILNTLLGIELKIGRRRLLCPDVATARFLSVFAGLGVAEVAVPYDITQMKRLADLFESAREEQLEVFESTTAGMTAQARGRIRNALIANQRRSIAQLGAGPQRPQFDQSTSQRRKR
jgi:hypothetical protein